MPKAVERIDRVYSGSGKRAGVSSVQATVTRCPAGACDSCAAFSSTACVGSLLAAGDVTDNRVVMPASSTIINWRVLTCADHRHHVNAQLAERQLISAIQPHEGTAAGTPAGGSAGRQSAACSWELSHEGARTIQASVVAV
jgi:hypothetical protein